jgi:Nuclear transport factor 2 (NTF2) domain
MTSTIDSADFRSDISTILASDNFIAGITNSTVLTYLNSINANDLEAIIDLFVEGGALQPPFQQPIVGKEQIRRYLEAECQNIKIVPDQGLVSYQDEQLTRLRVTGRMQTPWSGDNPGLHLAWRFSLDAHHQISLVAIDLMSAPPAS